MTRLSIRVQPGAKANEIVGWVADAQGAEVLKIRLRAPAIEGKANAALIEFLAEALGLRARHVTLERGDKSRDKRVSVAELTLEEIQRRTGKVAS